MCETREKWNWYWHTCCVLAAKITLHVETKNHKISRFSHTQTMKTVRLCMHLLLLNTKDPDNLSQKQEKQQQQQTREKKKISKEQQPEN